MYEETNFIHNITICLQRMAGAYLHKMGGFKCYALFTGIYKLNILHHFCSNVCGPYCYVEQ